MSHFFDIFFEAAWTASIFPFGNEPTFYALQSFGQESMALPLAAAVTGATLSNLFNWGIGKLLRKYSPTPSLPDKTKAIYHASMAFLLFFFAAVDLQVFMLLTAKYEILAGALPAELFAWFWLRKLYHEKPHAYVRFFQWLHRHGAFLLIFSWAPMCKLLPILAGVANIRLRTALAFILLGQIIHYALALAGI